MAKKRKSDASQLDEVERTMYSAFCSTANSLSQMYTHTMSQKKASFQAGERHALEKLYQWILRQHEEGSRATAADIVAYLQNEIDDGEYESSVSPTSQVPLQCLQSEMRLASLGTRTSGLSGQATDSSQNSSSDQTKSLVFPNALPSPSQGVLPTGTVGRNNEEGTPNQFRDSNCFSASDSSMDMSSDF